MPKIDLNNLEIRTCNSDDVKDIYNIQEIVINNFKENEKSYFLPFTEEWYLRIVRCHILHGVWKTNLNENNAADQRCS